MVHLQKEAVCILFFLLVSIKESQPFFGKLVLSLSGQPIGFWGSWGAWEVCSATCGKGVTTRRRTCSPVGAGCLGDNTNTTDCLLTACCVPRDGSWGDWSDWSTCSSPCGGGSRTRSRKCNEPNSCGHPCQGRSDESTACNVQECQIGAALDASCTVDKGGQSNCDDANAICTPDKDSKCQCKSGYEKSGTICILLSNVALDSPCAYTDGGQSNCDDANAVCTPRTTPTCQCNAGNYKSDSACIAKPLIGAACTPAKESNGDCSDVNAICSAKTNKCECKPGYTGPAGGK